MRDGNLYEHTNISNMNQENVNGKISGGLHLTNPYSNVESYSNQQTVYNFGGVQPKFNDSTSTANNLELNKIVPYAATKASLSHNTGIVPGEKLKAHSKLKDIFITTDNYYNNFNTNQNMSIVSSGNQQDASFSNSIRVQSVYNTANRFSTIIEASNENNQNNIEEDSLIVPSKPAMIYDPSPNSGVTRVNVTHVKTTNKVAEKVNQVNRLTRRSYDDSFANYSPYSPPLATTTTKYSPNMNEYRSNQNNKRNRFQYNSSNNSDDVSRNIKVLHLNVVNKSMSVPTHNPNLDRIAKQDNSTSPIVILESKYQQLQTLKPNYNDALTQTTLNDVANRSEEKGNNATKFNNISIQTSQLGYEQQADEQNVSRLQTQIYKEQLPSQLFKKKLEKSKLIVVNLTPDPANSLHQKEQHEYQCKQTQEDIEDSLNVKSKYNNFSNTSHTKKNGEFLLLKEKIIEEEEEEIEEENVKQQRNIVIDEKSEGIKAKLESFKKDASVSTQIDEMAIKHHDQIKLVDQQTPISTSNSLLSKSKNNSNINQDDELLTNELLTYKSTSYYNLVNKNNSNNNNNSSNSNEDVNAVVYMRDPLKTSANNSSSNQQKLNQPGSKSELDTLKKNAKTHGEHLSNDPKNSSSLSNEKNVAKGQNLITFYNGNKFWTIPTPKSPIKLDHEAGTRKLGINKEKYANILDEFEENIVNDRASLIEDNPKKKKKNLQVKIKLPDMDNIPKLPPRKERTLQKCCLVFFLLILFVIATGILIYFFGNF